MSVKDGKKFYTTATTKAKATTTTTVATKVKLSFQFCLGFVVAPWSHSSLSLAPLRSCFIKNFLQNESNRRIDQANDRVAEVEET